MAEELKEQVNKERVQIVPIRAEDSARIIEELRSSDPMIRNRALTTLRLRDLSSPYPEVRFSAILDLSNLSEERFKSKFDFDRIPHGTHPLMKDAMSDKEADSIARLLNDANPQVRRAAAEALIEGKTRYVYQMLCKAVSDSDKEVRLAALKALSPLGILLGEKGVARYLDKALTDEDIEVRKMAAKYLKYAGDAKSISHLKAMTEPIYNEKSAMEYFAKEAIEWINMRGGRIEGRDEHLWRITFGGNEESSPERYFEFYFYPKFDNFLVTSLGKDGFVAKDPTVQRLLKERFGNDWGKMYNFLCWGLLVRTSNFLNNVPDLAVMKKTSDMFEAMGAYAKGRRMEFNEGPDSSRGLLMMVHSMLSVNQ